MNSPIALHMLNFDGRCLTSENTERNLFSIHNHFRFFEVVDQLRKQFRDSRPGNRFCLFGQRESVHSPES